MEKLYAGVDIHKDKHVGCIVDQEGKVIREHTWDYSQLIFLGKGVLRSVKLPRVYSEVEPKARSQFGVPIA